MDGNDYSSYDGESFEEDAAPLMRIEQLERLVWLIDHSDVSEVEVRYPGDNGGTRLVLRKAKVPESGGQPHQELIAEASAPAPVETKHTITAPLVGTFHTWSKPRGGVLVAVGDQIKQGQLVGTIQSLNVLNDVESTVAGRVVEILVQEGQPVEYGQPLMVIDEVHNATV